MISQGKKNHLSSSIVGSASCQVGRTYIFHPVAIFQDSELPKIEALKIGRGILAGKTGKLCIEGAGLGEKTFN